MIKVGIIGATGYAGAELVRLITTHPQAEIVAISSVSFEGQKISDVYRSYVNINDMICENADDVVEKAEVIFAALPHGLSQELAKKCYDNDKVFIDLGADFRLKSEEEYKEWYKGEYVHKELHDMAVYLNFIVTRLRVLRLLQIRVVIQLAHHLLLFLHLMQVLLTLKVLSVTVKVVLPVQVVHFLRVTTILN